jgi:hypothetical protein
MGQAPACHLNDFKQSVVDSFGKPVDAKDVAAKLRNLGTFSLSLESPKTPLFYQRYAPHCSSPEITYDQLKKLICDDPNNCSDIEVIKKLNGYLNKISGFPVTASIANVDQIKAFLGAFNVSHGRIETDWVRVGLAAAVLLLLILLMYSERR